MKIIKEFIEYLKTEKRHQKQMGQLLNEKLDYDLLRKLLNELPSNPGVTLEIHLHSGDIIKFIQDKMEKPKNIDEGFDGLDYWRIG